MRFIIASLIALSATIEAWSAGLSGTVVNPWQTPIPQATITLTGPQTNLEAMSNQSGHYSFQVTGRFDLKVRAAGFKLYSRHAIEIAGETPSQLEIRMDPETADGPSIKELEAVSASKPGDYQAEFNLGRAYLANKDLNGAAKQFQAILKTRPDDLPAELAIADVALRAGILAAAVSYADDVLRVNPASGKATMIAAIGNQRLGNLDQAADLLDAFIVSSPNDSDVLLQCAAVKIRQKQYAEAEKAFGRAYEIDPSNLQGLAGVAGARLEMKQPEKAVDAVAREVQKDPQRADLVRELADIELSAGQFDKAAADYQSLLPKYKDAPKEQADIYAGLASVYQKHDDLPRALENLKLATQLAPKATIYVVSLAGVYELLGNSQQALKCYQEALRLEPDNGAVMNNTAYLLVKQGGDANVDEALRLVQLARRQMRDNDEVTDTLALVYLKKDMVDSASELFQELVEKQPANPVFHYHYGMALAKKGDSAAALDQLNQALQDKPPKPDEKEINDFIRQLSKAK